MNDLGERMKGKLDMPHLSSSKGKLLCTCDISRFKTLKYKIYHKSSFRNLNTAYPTYLPNIFSSFWMGALRLENPDFLLLF